MNLFARIADELRHARLTRYQNDQQRELRKRFDRETSTVKRAVLAVQIAGALESQANHLALSLLARMTTTLPPPGELREAARWWRNLSDDLFAEDAKDAGR